MLTKMVDGKCVDLTPEEEASVLARWKFMDTYPDHQGALILYERYSGAIHDNGVAKYDLDKAKEIHVQAVLRHLKAKIPKINKEIEIAEENINSVARDMLIQKRKKLRELIGSDEQGAAIANQICDFTNIDQLKDHLKIYQDMD